MHRLRKIMKPPTSSILAAHAACFLIAASSSPAADTRIDSWITGQSGKYARIYETDADLAAGTTKTTWSRNAVSQTVPAYSGVQEIYSSSNWVYIRTSGLGLHTMGPWYDNAARSALFVNIPANQKALYRFPRSPSVPATKVTTTGDLGYFVDGVDAFDARDATSYSNANGKDGDPPGGNGLTGDGIWNRDAYINEAITFDPALAHQQNTGVYHYHANPIATRFLLGDHVSLNPITKSYSESTNMPSHHSPIVAWARDGFPIYGPYGYSNPTNPASGLRRMISGFVLRDGQNGTTNLASIGRILLPAWAARAGNRSTTLIASQYGPGVSTSFPLGRYIEDNDYLGDLGKLQGVDFDLDEYNGRFCFTPEFPTGTYAYFVTITSNGLPTYPYNIGRQFYGTPSGGAVQSITESVTTNFVGGANSTLHLGKPVVSSNVVTLVWSATEGGTYRVESTPNFLSWSTNATNINPIGNAANLSFSATNVHQFYKVTRTGLAAYDSITNATTGGGGILSIIPTSGARGSTVTITINLNGAANPPPPPQQAPVNSVTVGAISGTSLTHVSQTQVRATFTIPGNAAIGPQTVTLVFPGPPDNPTQTVTYTLTNGFTVQ
jgi:hypothetical protein